MILNDFIMLGRQASHANNQQWQTDALGFTVARVQAQNIHTSRSNMADIQPKPLLSEKRWLY
jgi:hypothetical protein